MAPTVWCHHQIHPWNRWFALTLTFGVPVFHHAILVWVAADVGSQAINPGAAEHVLQGAVIDGLSELLQEITLKNGRVVESNYRDHPVLRTPLAPPIALPENGQYAKRPGRTPVASDSPSYL